MTIFFMPPTVKIIDSYELLEKDLFKIIVIIIVSTIFNYGYYRESCATDDRF